ncbi:hypothetical protein PFICI_03390 [Pestalotiopsis fici W106-1]|uniref:Phenylacetate 2-hydroxylase n=1 Tax=Pestalotiopsis fici (strain W106-1 / CGMCC3.15140) TaxID=1229662 RepID=W3XH53_PESFW|nr:uncharacterized protein PFICI_03390 [Pestalotiopsis fici W106-1]ETS85365.1 hypothetical protein PFICI_03390 [Pestalotiopsis fici W106-1]
MELSLVPFSTLSLPLAAIVLPVFAVILLCYLNFFYVDCAKINGIPEIPGGELLAGHLYQLGNDHATTAETWAAKYGWPVFQLRMGRRRAVFLNSFGAAREWLVKNQSSTVDRPWFHTFHGVVSKTSGMQSIEFVLIYGQVLTSDQAATIGTSPWNDRTKKQRRVVGSFTTGPAMQKMRDMLDVETCAVISGLLHNGKQGSVNIIPHMYYKRMALNLMTMFCYDFRFNSVHDPLLLQILQDAKTIASFRSTNSNPQDFIPHLRYTGRSSRTEIAAEVRARRDKWLAAMLDEISGRLKSDHSSSKKTIGRKCVAELLLEDSQEGLTQLDIKTILGGLMSGGFETVFSTAIIATGVLSTPQGQEIQQRAFDDILSVYDSPEQAFELCVTEEKSPYVTALVKETLRCYPPHKILPARQVYRDFEYNGVTVPKGVLIYVNNQAVNFDEEAYGADAREFRPERWIKAAHEIPNPNHFAFGAGARMCTAVNFSNRVLYAVLLRLILSFKIRQSRDMPPNVDFIDYKDDPAASNAVASDFKVTCEPRDEDVLRRCLEKTRNQSSESGRQDAEVFLK